MARVEEKRTVAKQRTGRQQHHGENGCNTGAEECIHWSEDHSFSTAVMCLLSICLNINSAKYCRNSNAGTISGSPRRQTLFAAQLFSFEGKFAAQLSADRK